VYSPGFLDRTGGFSFALPVSALHPKYYITYMTVGSVFDPLDDLFAALGKFTFRVTVGGRVSGKNVTITDVGVYLSDSYDFDGFQFLGCWNVCTNAVETGPVCSGSTAVTNEDFREW